MTGCLQKSRQAAEGRRRRAEPSQQREDGTEMGTQEAPPGERGGGAPERWGLRHSPGLCQTTAGTKVQEGRQCLRGRQQIQWERRREEKNQLGGHYSNPGEERAEQAPWEKPETQNDLRKNYCRATVQTHRAARSENRAPPSGHPGSRRPGGRTMKQVRTPV